MNALLRGKALENRAIFARMVDDFVRCDKFTVDDSVHWRIVITQGSLYAL